MNKVYIKEWLINHYTEPLPNDAIYLVRLMNLDKFLDFIEDTMKKSGKSLTMVCSAVEKNLEAVKGLFPYTDKAIDLFMQHNGQPGY